MVDSRGVVCRCFDVARPGASTAGAGLFVPLLEEVWASSTALVVAPFLKRLNGAIVMFWW